MEESREERMENKRGGDKVRQRGGEERKREVERQRGRKRAAKKKMKEKDWIPTEACASSCRATFGPSFAS